MAENPEKAPIAVAPVVTKGNLDLFKSTPLQVQSTHTAELVIALCGPIGSQLHTVAKLLKKLLEGEYAYKCEIIQLSKIIEEYKGSAPSAPRFERVKFLIENGNKLREEFGSSILADVAITKIATEREKHRSASGSAKYESRRICHIVDSVKNQEELEALHAVYRNMLYFIGVFSPLPLREKVLENDGMSLAEVYALIDRDSGEEIEHGQTVRDTFPHADFFLRIDSNSEKPVEVKLRRFLDIIFEADVVTPSAAETAMHVAASAAGNSACLSRQVGAALTDKKGEIIAVGWNDVPKAGGGIYQFDPEIDPKNDYRCIHRGGGGCSNDTEKNSMAVEIAKALVNSKLLKEEDIATASGVIRNSKVKSLLEFSRSVHAEMHAIIIGSQLAGERVKGGKLFCTTYPCHSCARHIVLAGIKEVYYIEPYRKSLATKLHDDAITEIESEKNLVRILPFDGVAPERYLELFRMKPDSRKEGTVGKKKNVDKKSATPKCEVSLESLPALEALVVQRLISKRAIEVTSAKQGNESKES